MLVKGGRGGGEGGGGGGGGRGRGRQGIAWGSVAAGKPMN